MNYLNYEEVLQIQQYAIKTSGGSDGIRDKGLLESAVNQPRQSYGGVDLYVTLTAKAAALGFSLIKNHAFIDGNKRVGYAAVEVFLMRNGYEIEGFVDDQEAIVLQLAAGELAFEEFELWLIHHIVPLAEDGVDL